MRKLALFGLAAVAMLGVTIGTDAVAVSPSHSHTTLADTGWGDPCNRWLPGHPLGCGGPRP
ncbi:hypothetical protein ACFZB9_35610 [Kitasatospora sp. NPDC008050]|uniref:hypothetical protein n=1 Tax=Kitasatospora sp. NPDC008050 TaxID=3364021 RepID=UPI0036E355D5